MIKWSRSEGCRNVNFEGRQASRRVRSAQGGAQKEGRSRAGPRASAEEKEAGKRTRVTGAGRSIAVGTEREKNSTKVV